MAKTRILLTGADSLTGSHILAQLLSHDVISVRAVVNSREAAYTLHQQYRQTSFSLDVVTVSDRDLKVPGALEDVLSDLSEPFHAVVHTLTANPSDEADCLARFINLETETTIRFLSAVQEVARVVGRVVIVTSLSPFAQWLVDPQVDREAGTDINGHSDSPTTDLEYVLATSQASNNIVSDAVMKWMKESDAPFDVAYVTAPSVYGPTVYPLETSSDLAETNRQIWNICSSEPRERTEMPPYGITHFADVRDVADASVRAVFVDRASSKRFVISAGIMPSGSEIAEYLVAKFPELRGRIRTDGVLPRQRQLEDPSLGFLDTYLMTTILGISQLRSADVTLTDTVRQILDLQQRKAWKSIIQS